MNRDLTVSFVEVSGPIQQRLPVEENIHLAWCCDHSQKGGLAAAVAALELGSEFNAARALRVFKGDIGLGQVQAPALIDAGRATQPHQRRPIGTQGRVGQRPAGRMAHRVMVEKGPAP